MTLFLIALIACAAIAAAAMLRSPRTNQQFNTRDQYVVSTTTLLSARMPDVFAGNRRSAQT